MPSGLQHPQHFRADGIKRIPTIWRPKDASPKYEQLAFLLQFLSRYLGEKCLFSPLTHPRPRPVDFSDTASASCERARSPTVV
jgi:hypothetical protein